MFYDKIPNKKPEVPTDILSLKVSLQLMANKAINQLLTTSTEKGLTNNENELTMTFVRDKIVGKICSVTHFYFRMVMGNKNASIPLFY